ncbi:MAG: LamG domain-containing protein [Woeseia sp.]
MTGPAAIALTSTRRLRTALAGLGAVAIAACGGGAATTQNPIGNITPPPIYSGPPPATADVQAFKLNVWDNLQSTNRCGSCHTDTGGQTPMFVRRDDINLAYQAANTVADLNQPANSRLVTKVDDPHHCWLTDPQACADIMTTWIERWAGAVASGGRQIVLQPPVSRDPGSSRHYDPSQIGDFAALVHGPILTVYCQGCHSSQSAAAQQPYFAEAEVNVAFDAVQPKMDLDDPASSRLVIRLRNESHNCWNVGCPASAQAMEDAITAFAATIVPTQIDPSLVNSKALRLVDGTIASGGNRFENAQIALWEFKTGQGPTAFDTSGVEPAIDLTLSGDTEWFGGWGVTINNGKAQGTTAASKKIHDLVKATGEFAVEAWIVPANVAQEMARIVSFSGGDTTRNFTLQQTLYDYDFRLRTTQTGLNGDPALSTPSANEVLQASLQHVVANYDPVNGRSIYVNGELVTQADPVAPGSLVDWQDTFALVLGSEVSGDGLFQGTFRLVAIHNRALTQAQIVQNFDVGVGEKFYLLFGIESIINVPTAYILFEVAQFDSWGYLFTRPHFITLDPAQQPEGIPIQGVRIGLNGAEAPVGQSYANLNDTLSASLFGDLGQPLATIGAVIPLEKGPADDEFFLTFDLLGSQSYARTDDPPLVIVEQDLPPAERIGVRTFDEINATFAEVTTVSPEDAAVDSTYQSLRQSLPTIEDPKTFLSSHQVTIAQLAFEYCNALMEDRGATSTAAMFPGFDFNAVPAIAYANRDALITPLIDRIMGIAIQSQPDFTVVRDELGFNLFDPVTGRPDNLIDRMIAPNPDPLEPQADTRGIAKGVCGAVLGSAIALMQ